MKRFVLIVFSLVCLFIGKADNGKVVIVESTYPFEIPSYMSYDQACREGVVKARNQAIDSAFYSTTGGIDIVNVKNKNGVSDVSLISIHRSQVRGIWLGDLAEPKFERALANDGRDFLNITVKGKVRELKSAGVQLEIKPLRVKPNVQLESYTFKNGDDFFLYFKSPVDGYLTVFLFDTVTNEVCYMLPYQSSVGKGYYSVKHGESYIFFSPETAKDDDGVVDEFVMSCSEGNQEEYDELYIVFSPNKYAQVGPSIKHEQINNDLILPDRMNYNEFNNWLMTYQQKDEDMQVARIPISIKNN